MSNAADDTARLLPNFDALWDYDHPDSTEVKFREILPLAENSDSKDYLAQLLTQIARTEGLQMNFDAAHKTLDRVEYMLGEDTRVAKARYLLERGRVFNSSNQKDKARPLFLQAFDYAVAEKLDSYALDAAHMMAIVEPPEGQLKWNLKALKIAEHSDNSRVNGWLGSLYNNIGWTYHDMGKFDTALTYFQKSYNWNKAMKAEKETRIAKWTIGRCYRSLGKIDLAMKFQREVVKEYKEKGLPNDGYSFEELGELYLLKSEPDSAKKYFGLAYEILSKDEWLQRDEMARLERMKKLGE